MRARDRKCVITGRANLAAEVGNWAGFHAAHIFPLDSETDWVQHSYGHRWLTDGTASINSPQNGLLMGPTMHDLFDQFLFSINPDVSNLGRGPVALLY